MKWIFKNSVRSYQSTYTHDFLFTYLITSTQFQVAPCCWFVSPRSVPVWPREPSTRNLFAFRHHVQTVVSRNRRSTARSIVLKLTTSKLCRVLACFIAPLRFVEQYHHVCVRSHSVMRLYMLVSIVQNSGPPVMHKQTRSFGWISSSSRVWLISTDLTFSSTKTIHILYLEYLVD